MSFSINFKNKFLNNPIAITSRELYCYEKLANGKEHRIRTITPDNIVTIIFVSKPEGLTNSASYSIEFMIDNITCVAYFYSYQDVNDYIENIKNITIKK